jgi:hypothetical protein
MRRFIPVRFLRVFRTSNLGDQFFKRDLIVLPESEEKVIGGPYRFIEPITFIPRAILSNLFRR